MVKGCEVQRTESTYKDYSTYDHHIRHANRMARTLPQLV
jgi:hypothetical protein